MSMMLKQSSWLTLRLPLFLGCMVSLLMGCSAVNDAQRAKELLNEKAEPVRFSPTPSASWRLPNGMTVLYRYDPEVPLVRGGLYLRSGGLWEDPEHVGSVESLGVLMRLGGAGKRSADELDLRLEQLAASVSSSFGDEYGLVAFSALDSDADEVFGIFADVVLRPRFDEERLVLFKRQSLEGIRRRKDDPGTIASTALSQLLYPGSPYGEVVVSADVQRLTRDLLTKLHAEHVFPDESYLLISGNLIEAEARRLAERSFGGWKPRGRALPTIPAVDREPAPRIVFVGGPFTQATVVVGQLGVPRLTPDHYAIEVFNDIFGTGAFSARLVQRVRTELGLAYVVHGGIFPGSDKGKNAIFLQTKSESVGAGLQAALGVLRDLQEREVPLQELEESQQSIQNSFVFRFDTTDEIVRREALLRLLRYPDGYDATYLGRIGAVSPSDIQRVARSLWDPAQFIIIVVGDEAAHDSLKTAVAQLPAPLPELGITRMTFDEKLAIR